ncbi:MAG TPA: LytTR family DNA-binding domain-containing protein [Chitinophagaceae bacterium]|nr:LytTR family DNA-binding domain-containing protein [Chitinophagaceae bacterium]
MSSPIRCMIIEDEPLAQNVLKKYIDEVPSLGLIAVCSNAMEAQDIVQTKNIQLLFLDINLPKLSGVNFLKTLPDPPLVIFTTAYPEFAVEGFELDAIDYLVKPISFERFLKAINKVLNKKSRQPGNLPEDKNADDFILLKADKKVYKINLEDILYAEATGDYVKVITLEGQYTANITLKKLLEDLPASDFIRVHKSYIISASKIKFFEGNYIKVGQTDIPIGAAFREEIFSRFKEKNI